MTKKSFNAWRVLLVAGAAAAALLVSRPANADLSMGDLTDVFEEIFEEYVLEPTGLDYWLNHIDLWLRRIEAARNSHLDDDGFDVVKTFPEEPEIFSYEDGAEHVLERYEDRVERVREVTGVAGAIVRSAPLKQERLEELRSASAAGCAATVNGCVMVGHGYDDLMAQQLSEIAAIQAEQAQLDADRAMMEDWKAVQTRAWAETHYAGSLWTGRQTFTKD